MDQPVDSSFEAGVPLLRAGLIDAGRMKEYGLFKRDHGSFGGRFLMVLKVVFWPKGELRLQSYVHSQAPGVCP